MRKLLNVLYVTRSATFLCLENENVVVKEDGKTLLSVPLLNLEGIISFSYFGATPQLMGECAKRNITLSFLNEYGRFIGTLYGESKGNVLLRKKQYSISESEQSLKYASCFVFGKIYNQRWVLERAIRDHGMRLDVNALQSVSKQLYDSLQLALTCDNKDSLRALEGSAAQGYFRVFNELILQNKNDFVFRSRSRRPPTDMVNALLSFAYTLLAAECRHSLETVGIDAFVGFLHTDRSGRASLALDLMEELRPHFADRFVLSLINRKEVTPADFEFQESGAVLLSDNGRKKFLNAWQERKREEITHPFLGEKIAWGLVPHIQALLLARVIRGELDKYPPFLWK